MNHCGLSLFAFGLLLGPTFAQDLPDGGYSPDVIKGITWPPGLEPSSFDDAYLGSFYGDVSVDGAILADMRAFLIYGIEFQASIDDVTPPGEDILAIAPVVPEVSSDAWGLAMLSDDGIWLHQHPGQATLLRSGTPWNGLDLLRPAKLDSAGKTDLIGATAYSVQLLHHDGSAWVDGAAFPLPGLLLDLVAVDWDGDGDDEIAVLTPNGLSVYEANGHLVSFFLGNASSGRIAAMPAMEGYPTGRLAWSFPLGTNHLLLVCSPNDSRVFCGTFAAAPAAISAAAFVEPSGALRVDLVTTAKTDLNLRYFVHKASGNPYVASTATNTVHAGASAPYGACRIAFHDISGDGIPDALFGRPGDGQAYFISGAEITFAGLGYPKLTLTPYVDPRMVWDDVEGEFWFQTHILLPNSYTPYTHVQLRVWESTDGVVLEQEELANLIFGITDTAYQPDYGLLAGEDADMRLAMLMPQDVGPCGMEDGNGYYFTMRLVTLANGRPNSASASVDASFTFNQDIADEMDPNSEGWLPLLNPECDPGGGSTAPALIKKPVWAKLALPPAPQDPVVGPQMPPLFQ